MSKSPFSQTLRFFREPTKRLDANPMRKFSLLAVTGDRVVEVGRWQTRFDSSKALRDARRAAIVQNWPLLPSCAIELVD